MELISKEEAIALIKAEMDKIPTHNLVDGTARINLRLAKNIIEDMPSIDIVRCQDCKYWVYNFNGCARNPCTEPWYATDFCNYGEREGE